MEQQKTIKDFSVTELKALCYDEIVKLEQCQTNIKVINQELIARSQPPVESKEELSPVEGTKEIDTNTNKSGTNETSNS